MNKNYKILLVTGCPRSGTTAIGKMLSLNRHIGNLYEPLNFHVGCHQTNKYFEFPGLDGFSYERLDNIVVNIQKLRLTFKRGGFPEDSGWGKKIKKSFGGRPWLSHLSCRINPFIDTIIWKDPFASFLCYYLSQRHKINSIVTLRSPWAVAGSFKRLGWSFDLDRIARGVKELGFDVDNHLSLLHSSPNDITKKATILWVMLYTAILKYRKKSKKILLIDIDKVVTDPLFTYKEIYRHLRIPWTYRISERIRLFYSNSNNYSAAPRVGIAHDWKRDFSQINNYYPNILTKKEIDFISEIAGVLWEQTKCECL